VSAGAVPKLRDFVATVGPGPSPSQILREAMALSEDYRTGAQFLDYAHAHWAALASAAGQAPDWSAFKPFEHPALLPHIVLYQRIDNRYRCSIVGDTVVTHLPMKLAGCFIDDVMPPENLLDVKLRLDAALDTEKPNFVEKTMAWQPGYDLKSYRTLQLPFPGAQGHGSRVMSVMDFRSDVI